GLTSVVSVSDGGLGDVFVSSRFLFPEVSLSKGIDSIDSITLASHSPPLHPRFVSLASCGTFGDVRAQDSSRAQSECSARKAVIVPATLWHSNLIPYLL